MACTTAHRLADYILYAAKNRGVGEVTNLKLQKLLYYSQAWYLATVNEELFGERIEAWIHGPVVPSVFGSFKAFRWKVLPVPAEEPDIEEGNGPFTIRQHVAQIFDAYGHLSGSQLEDLTHREDPWKNARGGIPCDAPSNAIISHESMRVYYQAKFV